VKRGVKRGAKKRVERTNGGLNKFNNSVLCPMSIFMLLRFLDESTMATVGWSDQLNARVRTNSRNVKRIDGNKGVVLGGNNEGWDTNVF